MDRPILKALILLILGIVLSRYVDIPFITIGIILILNILLCLYNIIKGGINQSLLILFFILGIFLSSIPINSYLLNQAGSSVYVEGLIKEIDNNKFILRASKVDGLIIDRENILVYYQDTENLKLGMEIGFMGKIIIPSENTNPKLYNNRLDLLGDNIYTSSYSNSVDIIKEEASIRYELKNKFIKSIESLIDHNFSEDNKGFLKAIILGKTSYLIDESLSRYRNLGLGHLLAISGMHIGIISMFILFILKKLSINKKKAYILTLILIWMYAFFINFPISVIRANIMLSFLFYSKIFYEPYESLDIVLISMIILLVINPYYLYQIGFQLSFGAVFSILLLAPKIRNLFYPYRNYMTDSLSILIGIQIGLLPIQVYYFNEINLLGIISNLLIIPVISILLILVFLFIIFNKLLLLNLSLKILIEGFMGLQVIIINILDKIDILKFSILSLDLIIIFYYYILVLIGFKYININKLNKAFTKSIFIYFIFLLVINISIFNRDTLKIDFIDVGQGDAILIREKNKSYLVDTGGSVFGNFNIPEAISIPYMKKLGINRIDGFFISHFHEDHSQGFASVLREFKVENIYISYFPEIEDYRNIIYENKDRVFILKKGDNLNLSKNLSINVLWPDENMINYLGENDRSLVLNLNFKGKDLLLTGDIEAMAENRIRDEIKNIDFLKVAHHGSKTSTGIDFLNVSSPKYSIIQVGRNNRYGHPNEEVIDLLNDMDIKIYRNDEDGLISLEIQEDRYKFKTYLRNGNIEKNKIDEIIFKYNYEISFYILYYLFIYILIRITYGNERKSLIDIH